ncbi:MAG: PAS domain S-box protein [Armatimonadetes bacterium]|nr:PAS domain S-box protein [Armatimonadota bacterium]
MFDRAGEIVYTNPGALDLLGHQHPGDRTIFDLLRDPDSVRAFLKGSDKSCRVQLAWPQPGPCLVLRQLEDTGLVAAVRSERAMMSAAPDLTFHLDCDGKILDCHAGDPDLLYLRPEQFLGRNVAEVLPPQPARAMCNALRLALEVHQPQNVEYSLELRGDVHHFEARFVPCGLRDAVAIVRDITDHRRAGDALRQSEDRYRRLFATVSDAIVLFDSDNLRFLDVNDAAVAAYGYSREELLRMTVLDVSAEPEQTRTSVRLAATGELARIPLRFHLRKDGSAFPVEISASSFQQGERRLICGVIRDVTERRKAEAQLRRLASQLVLAEERERRRIAADLHDRLAQNLAMCLIRVGLLQEKSSEEVRASLDPVRELLEDSIQRAQSLTFELSPPALYDLGLPEAVRSLGERLLKPHGLRFEFRSTEPSPPLGNDLRVLLFRAIRELFINVIKHARATWVKTGVTAREGRIEIVVEDDGIGFETGPEPVDGGGFGLFNVRERLGQMGGGMEISATPGSGTRVLLTAPVDLG